MKGLLSDNMFKLSFLVVFTLGLYSCVSESAVSREFLDYYYPVDQLEDGMVYEYRPVNNDSLPVDYWYYRSHQVGKTLEFTGNYYNESFVVQQFIRENQEEDGMRLKDFILYENHEDGTQSPISVNVTSNHVFPHSFSDSTQTWKMGLKWDIPGETGTTISLNRKRKYIGSSAYDFKNKKYESAVFSVIEDIEHFVEDDGYLEPSFPGIEIYAKGIGLIYYKKQLTEDFEIEYKLYDRYTMKAFEKKYKRSLKG